jgi:hypothetical protein
MRTSRTSLLILCLLVAAPVALVDAPPAAGQSADPVNVLTLELGTLGGTESFGIDISPSGLVVGSAQNADGAWRPFSYQLPAGPMIDIGTLAWAEFYHGPLGVTDDGVVIGYASNYTEYQYEVWAVDATVPSPTMRTLPFPDVALGSRPWMYPEAMNRDGWVVGWWGDDTDVDDYRAFVYDPDEDETTNLGYFGYDWNFKDVAASAAVGYKEHGDSFTGFVQPLDASARIDLNDEFGWDESYANAINDAGMVVGEYRDGEDVSENWFAFAWDQTNSPVVLPRRDGVYNSPTLVSEDWIIGQQWWPLHRPVVYDLTDLEAQPVLLAEMGTAHAISDEGVVVGSLVDGGGRLVAYDLRIDPAQPTELPMTDGVYSGARAVVEFGGHTIVVGRILQSYDTYHNRAVAWVLGVPDAPSIALVADSDGIDPVSGVTADTTPTLAGTTEPGGQVVVRRDSEVVATITADATTGAWSYTSDTLADGTYELTATLQPADGWPSNPATLNITIETIPAPTVTVGTATVRGSTVTVPFTITGTYDPASLTCQLDDGAQVACDSSTGHTFTNVTAGGHDATVRATTPTGLTGSGSTTFTVKGKTTEPIPPPGVLTVTITKTSAARNGPVTVNFTATGGTAPYDYTCSLTGGTTEVTESCESPWTYPGDGTWLAGGKYQVTVSAVDSADPPGSATATATVNIPGAKK